ncbi:deoxynucleoside triphosphate triphosphohydrolase SAMHD1-like [Ptychodera flava]|uniref:deoxynucleoside triphosphate triphosphohydrolase SAMHD1-like n=1 Tax=Ptychodera flava TaxID=63121 RepID=UPI00396A5099
MAARKRKDADNSSSSNFTKRAKLSSFNYREWSASDVCKFLVSKGFKDVAQVFRRHDIVGSVLSDITEERLQTLGVEKMGRRLQLVHLFQELCSSGSCHLKVFNDPIHGHIELHPLCIRIIDTPQFQRLRDIKQLGACYLVFPGAAHNRFEHSIGVCYLAGQLAKRLQERQPELQISEVDILCVQIAGLCHDLGHGPFSHMFDQLFIPLVRPDAQWKHENASVEMFDYLIEDNELLEIFSDHGLTQTDITFIKEQIAGPLQGMNNKEEWPYKGRDKEKSFLYEIVANKRNGIDVDKWDYFARDCHNLGIRNNFDYRRFQQFARVIKVDDQFQICCREKEVGNLYDMFHTRNTLHRRAYQHKVNKIIESMIVEALVKADDHIKFPGKNGKYFKMSECIDDMQAYCQLTDYVLHRILQTTEPELEESRSLLMKVKCRKLYKCIGQTQPPTDVCLAQDDVSGFKEEIAAISHEIDTGGEHISPDRLVAHVVNLNYGMGHENPIDHVRFYSKDNPDQAMKVRKNEVSQMLPEKFAEQHLRVYSKDKDPRKLEVAILCFQEWCEKKGFTKPKAGNAIPELTPLKLTAEQREESVFPVERSDKSRGRLSF